MNNPLIDSKTLPPFDIITPEHVAPALDMLLASVRSALAKAASTSTPADYEFLSRELDVPVEKLATAWTTVSHLHAVANTPALRAAYQHYLPLVTGFYTELGGDPQLYLKYKALAGDPVLSPARRRAMSNTVRDALLSGAELDAVAKERFAQVVQASADLSQRFANNVLDATDRYVRFTTAEELAGMPADFVSAARAASMADGSDGCKLGLQASTYRAVMRHADNRALRAEIYRAYTTRASEFGPREFDNTRIMRELLALRQERARLLGLDNYVEVSLVSKMADTPAQIETFLSDLALRARAQAQRDIADLREYARRHLDIIELEAWDVDYVSEKLRQSTYSFSQQEVKQYFSIDRVISGLFGIISALFDLTVVELSTPVWHESVRAYRLERGGEALGSFYLDLFARPGKRAGAWMNGAVSRWLRPGGSLRSPISYVVCNFAPPGQHGEALLSHDDLVILFHEFGHNLHFLLSRIDDLRVSGISGVEWDAVELPSQLMENFCWQWEVLTSLSSHAHTGATLPRELFDKMSAARNFQSGLQVLRQVEFALLDLRLHAGSDDAGDAMTLLSDIRTRISPLPIPEYNRFPNSFSHIFAGAYAAGYYSYLWAEVLSADAWGAFDETDLFDAAAWRSFRESVLEVGGSRPMSESYQAFRGRPPSIDALLRQRGMATAT